MTSTTRTERVGKPLAQVGVGNVLLHHALGIEKRSVDGNGMLHDGKVAAAILVEERKNHVFEFRIQAFGVSRVVCRSVGSGVATVRFANRPAGHALDVALDPPAVENAEA